MNLLIRVLDIIRARLYPLTHRKQYLNKREFQINTNRRDNIIIKKHVRSFKLARVHWSIKTLVFVEWRQRKQKISTAIRACGKTLEWFFHRKKKPPNESYSNFENLKWHNKLIAHLFYERLGLAFGLVERREIEIIINVSCLNPAREITIIN